MNSSRTWRWRGLAAFAVILAALWLADLPGRPPAAPESPGPTAAIPAAGAANGTASVAAVEPAVRAAVATGIRGRLRNAAGQPLSGWRIELRDDAGGSWPPLDRVERLRLSRPDPTPRAAPVVTDDHGAFAVPDLPPRAFEVRCADWPEVATTVTVGTPAASAVELRLPDTAVVVHGTPMRGGDVAAGTFVVVRQDGGEKWTRACDERGFSLLLRPGRYTVRCYGPPVRGEGVCWSEHELVVPTGVATWQWSCAAGGTLCEVVVRARGGRDGTPVGVDINGTAAIGGGAGTGAIGGTSGAVMRLWLPPGTWRLHAHGPALAAMPERDVVVDAASPPLRLEFDAAPAAPVALVLRDERGQNVFVAPDLLPPLCAGAAAVPCAAGKESPKLAFQHVPLGAAAWRLEDRVVDGQLVFLPFAPREPVVLHVDDGGANTIELTVQRRAFADVRACDATGREDGTACVTVWHRGQRVRGRDEPFAQRWAAWLPPGGYRVVVDRNGVEQEHQLVVGSRDVTLRLRP